MALGLVGRKVGMTRIFGEGGEAIPVTILEVVANRITQKKTADKDGYSAVQLAFGSKKSNRLNKAEAGVFAKAGVEAGSGLIEFRLSAEEDENYAIGKTVDVSLFSVGQHVDVTGLSKGKGFAGNIKRHNFSSQRASHGNSLSHRVPGSIGQCQDPGRVFPGKKMPGHLGAKRVTTQNLEIIRVDAERNLLLIKGAVPGAKNGDVLVKPTEVIKAKKEALHGA